MTKSHIGKKIRIIRRLKGLTQEELAQKINKTRALVAHIERTGKISFYTLSSIAEVLNISPDTIKIFNEKNIIASEQTPLYGKSELDILKEKLEGLQKENNIFRELIESQKKVILMLENQVKKKK